MGRIFRQDGPFLLNAISTLGGMTWAWSASVAIYLLIMLLVLALEPKKREQFPPQLRWKMAAATVAVAAAGIAIQCSANNLIRRRNVRTLSGPIQPASQPPRSPPAGFWPRVRKLLIDFCLWLVGVSVYLGLLAWVWVVVQAVGGLMKLGWAAIAGALLAAITTIVWTVVVRRQPITSKQPLWVESEPQAPQSAPIERADEPARTDDVLRYHSKLEDESAGGNLDLTIGLGLTMCGLLMLSTAWAAITVNRFNLSYRLIVAAISVGLAALLAKAAWGRFKLGFMWLDRERVKAERLQAAKKLQKEGILSKVQRDSAMANCGGGVMAEQSNQNRPVELPYRAGREDMRPKSGADLGCAVVFILIALLMLALIGFVVRYNWRRNGITGTSMLVIIGLGIFAAGSIIAACARLTRHRWWATRDWKEDWRPPPGF